VIGHGNPNTISGSWVYSDFTSHTVQAKPIFVAYESTDTEILDLLTRTLQPSGSSVTTPPPSVSAMTTVPALVLEPITTGPPTAAPTHSAIPSYSGQGNLLQGYCATPEYVLLDGTTAYWAPAVGCIGDKTDCCPYAATTTTVTVVSTVTVDVGPSSITQSLYAGPPAYPTPVSANQAILAHCPDDYQSVLGGCCPS
jgi:hypothetical protein